MAKQPRDRDFDPVTVGTDEAAQEGVDIIRSETGAIALVPRSVGSLRGEALEISSELQREVYGIRQAQERVESLVHEGREVGMSWNALGWCVGTTGDAARRRWGMDA